MAAVVSVESKIKMSLRGYKPKTKPALWKQLRPTGKTLCEVFAKEARDAERAKAKAAAKLAKAAAKAKTPRQRVSRTSDAQRVRNSAYKPVAEAYKLANPKCHCCGSIFARPARATSDVHHSRGKLGALLTDTRFFIAACRECHNWIGDHPDRARSAGLLCNVGSWNRSEP